MNLKKGVERGFSRGVIRAMGVLIFMRCFYLNINGEWLRLIIGYPGDCAGLVTRCGAGVYDSRGFLDACWTCCSPKALALASEIDSGIDSGRAETN